MKDEAYTDNVPNLTGKEMVCKVTTAPMIQKVELKLTFISYVILLQQHMHSPAGWALQYHSTIVTLYFDPAYSNCGTKPTSSALYRLLFCFPVLSYS